MFSHPGLGIELTHIPLTLVDSFSASHMSGKNKPTQTGCLETRSAVSNREMSCWESHGDVDGSRAATPHTETWNDTKRTRKKIKKNTVWAPSKEIVREHRENLRTSQLYVPSTPTLLINLWGLASLYRDCFHQTAQAIKRVAADMLFNKSVGAPFSHPDIKRTSNGLMLHTAGMFLVSTGYRLWGHSDRWCLKSSHTSRHVNPQKSTTVMHWEFLKSKLKRNNKK